jgi:hypothetical protein
MKKRNNGLGPAFEDVDLPAATAPVDPVLSPPTRTDLSVLLAELNRVRAPQTGPSTPSAAEAITLAAAAMRLVEAQLNPQIRGALDDADFALSRDLLRATLDVLRAALAGLGEHAEEEANRGIWARRRAKRTKQTQP